MPKGDETITIVDDVTVMIALACDNVSQDPQQRFTLHTIIDQLNAPIFPTTTPSIYFVFGFQRKLAGFMMQCKIEVLPEAGPPIASQAIPDVVFRPGQPGYRQIAGFAGIVWPKPGVYTVSFSSRGKVMASFSLPLVLVKPPGSVAS